MANSRYNDVGAEYKPVEQGGTILKQLAAQAITAGTAVTIHTPATGKKFRVRGYALSLSVAGSVILKFGAGNTEFMRTPLLAAGVGLVHDQLGAGVIPGADNDALKVDATATGTISGYILIDEED